MEKTNVAKLVVPQVETIFDSQESVFGDNMRQREVKLDNYVS